MTSVLTHLGLIFIYIPIRWSSSTLTSFLLKKKKKKTHALFSCRGPTTISLLGLWKSDLPLVEKVSCSCLCQLSCVLEATFNLKMRMDVKGTMPSTDPQIWTVFFLCIMLNAPLELINSSLTLVLIFDETVAAFLWANWRSGHLCCLLETFKLYYSVSGALCVVYCMIRCRITMQLKGWISVS